MPVCPTLTKHASQRLRSINPHLYARWDRRKEQWEIGRNNHLAEPQVILYATHPLTDRTLDTLRRAFWISSHGVMRWAQEQLYRQEAAQAKSDANLKDWSDDAGKDIGKLACSLNDAGSASHGNSVYQWPGMGDSTLHGGDV